MRYAGAWGVITVTGQHRDIFLMFRFAQQSMMVGMNCIMVLKWDLWQNKGEY